MKEPTEENPTPLKKEEWVIYFDGGFQWETKRGTFGYVIIKPTGDKIKGSGIMKHRKGIVSTSNISEYNSLISALSGLKHYLDFYKLEPVPSLVVYGDSRLVICQCKGLWKTKKDHLRTLKNEVLELLNSVSVKWELTWIPREQNKECDRLSKNP